MQYIFPAIFEKEDDGFSVYFPDLEGCYTQGESIAESLNMAQDVLCLMLCELEDTNSHIPPASDISCLKVPLNGFSSLISADTLEYRKKYSTQSVKKTLSIPSWLNTLAIKNNVNFSNVLQNALRKELNV